MASCLYECLCEAELEKYYPHFTALGFQKIDDLAKVSMKDYAKLGVHNMKDRKRLFQLIRIIKILQAEEEVAGKNKQHCQTGAVYLQPQVTRSGPRRQLQFDSLLEERGGRKDFESGLCALSSCSVNKEKDDLAAALGQDSEYKKVTKDTLNASAVWTECKVGIPAISSSSEIAPLLGNVGTPIVQRVAHLSGYNYGVPHSCIRPNVSEKDTPWTETDKIRVCVRKRPLGLREERRGEVNIITVEDKETLLLHEKKEAVDLTQYILQHVFYFDEVFGEACSNWDVYVKTAHPLIQHIFNGGNATCFAYGQTGAGKTYTMIGSHQNPGLYALAAKDIFRQLETSPARKDLRVWISFYEIYCGQLYDLLNERKRLFAREDSKHVVQIVGLREVQVDTVSLLLEVILKGGKERSTGATGVNSDSSRSHAIIQIQIKDASNRVFGRISFIDLAGSERAADARDSDRQTKMEGAEINQSLLALKECIRALDQEHAHTPFRQSKLTQVLKDSFVGNSKTCMIANVSPSHVATEHTLNTLRYADRVKELKKGMSCCMPAASRRRPTGSLSPKRVQGSPCVQAGEKSSPKKVKLGSQPPPATGASARLKASPLLLHPGPPPFYSTPKGQARKGYSGAALLSRSSPLRGAPRAEPPARKMPEDPALPSEKNHLGQDVVARREGGQGDRQQVGGQKAPPVRKQLIPRTDFSLGDTSRSSAQAEEGGRAFAEQCAVAWTSLPPQQKEREQHLRLYHQQFQQPPLLQQKLNYQPLEKFLSHYKAQEVWVKPEPPCQSPQGRDETMQLEDLDDSDFSEDSFSPGPSQRKPEAGAAREHSQGSFFLHQRECGTDGQELFFKQRELRNQGGLLCRMEEAAGYEEGSKSPSDWSTQESATLNSSPRNDTPEKPYCSQDDSVACDRASAQDVLLKQKQPTCRELCLGLPAECFSLPEETPQSPPSVHKLAPARCIADGQREESVKGMHAPLSGNADKVSLRAETGLREALDFSVDFVTGLMPPLTVSLLDAETTDIPRDIPTRRWQGKVLQKERMEKKPCSPRKRLDEETSLFAGNGVHETDHLRKAAQALSPQAKTKWVSESCPSPKAHSPFEGASPSSVAHSCACGLSAEGAALAEIFSPCTKSEGALILSDLQFTEYVASPHYDADTEVTTVASLSCAGQFTLGEEDGSVFAVQLKPTDMLGKGSVSSALPISENAGKDDSPSIPPQSSLEFRKLELDCAQEAFKLALKQEEMGLLKNKCIQSTFTHDLSDAAGQNSQLTTRGGETSSPKNSLNVCGQLATPESSVQYKEALGRQFVLQIHREQLNEMASLCFQEESLISQMSALDFEAFVVKLDETLLLKSKCIQRMRTQLQPLLTTPVSGTALQRTSQT